MHTVDITVRNLAFRWSLAAKLERIFVALVWALPHHLVYWCASRVWANATSGKFGNESPFDISANDMVHRWERHEGGDPAFR